MADELDGTEQRLQRSSRVFLMELERLRELELRKREMPEDDPERIPLSQEIEDVAQGLRSLSRSQTRLIELGLEAQNQDKPARPQAEILGEWRDAERRLHEASVLVDRATDDADRLRDEYRRGAQRQ